MSAGPSWYDLLGVDQDASSEEIRSAWRAAIADLDPSDRRFRSYNQAAEVLLDPASRSAYDAGLDGAGETVAPAEPVTPAVAATAPAPSEQSPAPVEKSPRAPRRRLPVVPACIWKSRKEPAGVQPACNLHL